MNVAPIADLFSSVPMDWIIVAVIAIAAVLFTLQGGTSRTIAGAIALLVAFSALGAIPGALVLGNFYEQIGSPLVQAVFSLAAFVLAYVLMRRIIGSSMRSGAFPLPALLAGLGFTAILLIVWLQIPALDSIWVFGEQARAVFSDPYRLWWLIGSFAALAYSRR